MRGAAFPSAVPARPRGERNSKGDGNFHATIMVDMGDASQLREAKRLIDSMVHKVTDDGPTRVPMPPTPAVTTPPSRATLVLVPPPSAVLRPPTSHPASTLR